MNEYDYKCFLCLPSELFLFSFCKVIKCHVLQTILFFFNCIPVEQCHYSLHTGDTEHTLIKTKQQMKNRKMKKKNEVKDLIF